MARNDEGREIVEVKSLEDLEISKVTVELDLGEGFPVYYVPMRILSLGEWLACAREIERPSAAVGGGTKGTVYDYNNIDYLKAMELYNEKVMYRRLLRALLIDIPGKDDAAKIEALATRMGAGATMTLLSILNQYHNTRMAQVETRAHSFLNGGDSAPESDGAAEPDGGEL